jgi:predicted ATPase
MLQRDFAELVVSQPEQLAHHCSEAGMIAEAIEYYLLAAQRATAASNNTEKIAHIARGLTLVEQLPASDQRTAELRKRLTLGGAFFLY